MRPRTVAAVAVLVVALAALVAFGLGLPGGGGTLEERWVSDTARDNRVNHHAVGVGPEGQVVVAPVAEVPNSDVALTNTSCTLARLAPADGAVVWRDPVPASDCFTHALTEPAIADIDGDGALEVAAATTEDALVVTHAANGTERFRVSLSTFGYGRPTVADIRPAAGSEIVVSDIDGTVVLVRANGSTAWRTPLNETFGGRASVWRAPVVTDVDGDGGREIAIGSGAGVAVLSPNGTVEWTRAGDATYLAVGQADDDAARELFTADGRTLRAVDGSDRSVEWERTLGASARVRTVADVDDDGESELLAGLTNGTVLSLAADTGTTEWTTTVTSAEQSTVSPPVVANVDAAGPPEVVAAARDGTVSVLDGGSGAERSAYERSVPVWTFPTAADIDGDDRTEVLVRYGDGRVVALSFEE